MESGMCLGLPDDVPRATHALDGFEASLHLLDFKTKSASTDRLAPRSQESLMLGQLPLARSHHLSDAFIRELSLHEQRVP